MHLRCAYQRGRWLFPAYVNLSFFTREQYAVITQAHSIYGLSMHVCGAKFISNLVVFKPTLVVCRVFGATTSIRDADRLLVPLLVRLIRPLILSNPSSSAVDLPSILTFEEKRDIIFEHPKALKRVMGICGLGSYILASDFLCVDAKKVPLDFLRNDCFPEHTLPRSHDLELYSRVISHPEGMKIAR
ncbi:hypothetical protein BDR04DRAFT_1234814 [Suillus decipiens]|nr:hypothetical protein BDR04DRAFT_1234814 [Suillus decipiens]